MSCEGNDSLKRLLDYKAKKGMKAKEEVKRTLCDVGGLPQLSKRDNLGYTDPPYGSSSAPINCPDVEDAGI
ncbi:hypothetical protein WN943_019425 [Citrus x changshan-huyou]